MADKLIQIIQSAQFPELMSVSRNFCDCGVLHVFPQAICFKCGTWQLCVAFFVTSCPLLLLHSLPSGARVQVRGQHAWQRGAWAWASHQVLPVLVRGVPSQKPANREADPRHAHPHPAFHEPRWLRGGCQTGNLSFRLRRAKTKLPLGRLWLCFFKETVSCAKKEKKKIYIFFSLGFVLGSGNIRNVEVPEWN